MYDAIRDTYVEHTTYFFTSLLLYTTTGLFLSSGFTGFTCATRALGLPFGFACATSFSGAIGFIGKALAARTAFMILPLPLPLPPNGI